MESNESSDEDTPHVSKSNDFSIPHDISKNQYAFNRNSDSNDSPVSGCETRQDGLNTNTQNDVVHELLTGEKVNDKQSKAICDQLLGAKDERRTSSEMKIKSTNAFNETLVKSMETLDTIKTDSSEKTKQKVIKAKFETMKDLADGDIVEISFDYSDEDSDAVEEIQIAAFDKNDVSYKELSPQNSDTDLNQSQTKKSDQTDVIHNSKAIDDATACVNVKQEKHEEELSRKNENEKVDTFSENYIKQQILEANQVINEFINFKQAVTDDDSSENDILSNTLESSRKRTNSSEEGLISKRIKLEDKSDELALQANVSPLKAGTNYTKPDAGPPIAIVSPLGFHVYGTISNDNRAKTARDISNNDSHKPFGDLNFESKETLNNMNNNVQDNKKSHFQLEEGNASSVKGDIDIDQIAATMFQGSSGLNVKDIFQTLDGTSWAFPEMDAETVNLNLNTNIDSLSDFLSVPKLPGSKTLSVSPMRTKKTNSCPSNGAYPTGQDILSESMKELISPDSETPSHVHKQKNGRNFPVMNVKAERESDVSPLLSNLLRSDSTSCPIPNHQTSKCKDLKTVNKKSEVINGFERIGLPFKEENMFNIKREPMEKTPQTAGKGATNNTVIDSMNISDQNELARAELARARVTLHHKTSPALQKPSPESFINAANQQGKPIQFDRSMTLAMQQQSQNMRMPYNQHQQIIAQHNYSPNSGLIHFGNDQSLQKQIQNVPMKSPVNDIGQFSMTEEQQRLHAAQQRMRLIQQRQNQSLPQSAMKYPMTMNPGAMPNPPNHNIAQYPMNERRGSMPPEFQSRHYQMNQKQAHLQIMQKMQRQISGRQSHVPPNAPNQGYQNMAYPQLMSRQMPHPGTGSNQYLQQTDSSGYPPNQAIHPSFQKQQMHNLQNQNASNLPQYPGINPAQHGANLNRNNGMPTSSATQHFAQMNTHGIHDQNMGQGIGQRTTISPHQSHQANYLTHPQTQRIPNQFDSHSQQQTKPFISNVERNSPSHSSSSGFIQNDERQSPVHPGASVRSPALLSPPVGQGFPSGYSSSNQLQHAQRRIPQTFESQNQIVSQQHMSQTHNFMTGSGMPGTNNVNTDHTKWGTNTDHGIMGSASEQGRKIFNQVIDGQQMINQYAPPPALDIVDADFGDLDDKLMAPIESMIDKYIL